MNMFKGCSKMYYEGKFLIAHYPIYVHVFDNNGVEMPEYLYKPTPITELRHTMEAIHKDMRHKLSVNLPPLPPIRHVYSDYKPRVVFKRKGIPLFEVYGMAPMASWRELTIEVTLSWDYFHEIDILGDEISKFPIKKLSKKKRKLVEEFIVKGVIENLNPV